MLELQGLALGAQGRLLLDGFNLSFPDPGLYVLRGPVASGKTLLCRVIAGLQRPAGGRVSLDGHELYPRFGVFGGSIFHADGRADFAELESVEEYAASVLQVLTQRKKLRTAMDRLRPHLPLGVEAPVALLSAGQFALLEIVLAWSCGWRLLVLDGQLSCLDGDYLRSAWDLLRELALEQDSFIICSAGMQLRDFAQEAMVHTLTGALPVEVLPELETPPGAGTLSDQGQVLRLRLSEADQPGQLTSGRTFTLQARREGWIRVELKGGLDELLAEMNELGLNVEAIEFVRA